jgi:hypothetical protein
VSGILAASTIAVLGLFVLPYRRRTQRAEFRAKVDKLKEQIDDVLAQHLEREMTKIRDRILDNISPYTRYESKTHRSHLLFCPYLAHRSAFSCR